MCLSTATKIAKPHSGYGYKVVRVCVGPRGKLRWRSLYFGRTWRPVKKWCRARRVHLCPESMWGKFYLSGFHMLKQLADVEKYVGLADRGWWPRRGSERWWKMIAAKVCRHHAVVRVKFEGADWWGLDDTGQKDGARAVVAPRMMVEKILCEGTR